MVSPASEATLARTCFLISWAIIVAALYWLRDVLEPLALAILLSFLLAPIVSRLERSGLPRIPAVVLSVVLAALVAGLAGYMVTGQLVSLAAELPRYRTTIEKKIEAFRHPEIGPLSRALDTADELLEQATKEDSPPAARAVIVEPPSNALDLLRVLLGQAIAMTGTGAVVAVCVLFFLIEREEIRDRLIFLAGRQRVPATTQALNDAGTRVSRYLLMQLVANTIFAVPVGIGLFLLGIPNAPLWAFLCGVLRFIPYLGPVVGAALPILVSVAVFDGWIHPLLVGGLFIATELVVNNLVEPWLYSTSTGLSKTAIVVAAIFWTWLWGGLGLLLSTPLTVCLLVMGKYVPQLRFLDVLLGARSGMSPGDQLYQRLLANREDEAAKVVHEFLKGHSRDDLGDEVFLPALFALKAGWQDGFIDDRQLETACEMIEDISSNEEPTPVPQERARGVILIPASDLIDETAARVVGSLLPAAKIPWTVLSSKTLAGELISEVAKRPNAIVAISAMPPLAQKHARYLAKRILNSVPEVRIIVGLWNADQGGLERLRAESAISVYPTARKVVEAICHSAGIEPPEEPSPDDSGK